MKRLWRGLCHGLALPVICGCYILYELIAPDSTAWMGGIMVAGCLLSAGMALRSVRRRSLSPAEATLRAVLAIGLILRIGYMLITPCNVRSHDIASISADSGRHDSWILILLQTRALPQDNQIQHYQQPLFYLLATPVSALVNGILGRNDPAKLVDAAKLISCWAGCMQLLLVLPAVEEFGLKSKGKAAALALAAFLPGVSIPAGAVNPDMLTALWGTCIFLYLLKWEKKQSWGNTLLLALFFGLGVMTKISCALLAIPALLLFVQKGIHAARNRNLGTYAGKMALFGGVSLPLGLWYSVRNLIRFAQPLNYTLPMTKSSRQFHGNLSLFSRLFCGLEELLQTPWADPFRDWMAPPYILKTACFGEYTYQDALKIPGWLLLFAVFALAVCLLVSMAGSLREKDAAPRLARFMVLLGYVSLLIFYVKAPWTCSVDFRYILFIVVPFALLCGAEYEKESSRALLMRGLTLLYSAAGAVWIIMLAFFP